LVDTTHTAKKIADTQNNDVQLPSQLSFFFAGEVTPHIGSFMQITYSQADDKFGWDNADIRYANETTLANAATIYGLTLNNSPTVEDPWNSTPTWGYPFISSSTAPEPAAAALVDGGLAQDVAGLGAYAFWNNHLYGNLTLYRSSHLGQGAPDSTSSNTITDVAPYWRLAWQQNIGSNLLEIGTYGLSAKLYPSGVGGKTDNYTDTAVDAQFEMPMGNNQLSLHMNYIYEKQKLNVTDPGDSNHDLNDLRLNGIYHWGNRATAALGYFDTNGDSNTALWGTSNGKPDTEGWLTQVSYLPWQNTKFGIQYTGYTMFDGTSNNASDNNVVYAFGWLVW
jgi:hypothetical protein